MEDWAKGFKSYSLKDLRFEQENETTKVLGEFTQERSRLNEIGTCNGTSRGSPAVTKFPSPTFPKKKLKMQSKYSNNTNRVHHSFRNSGNIVRIEDPCESNYGLKSSHEDLLTKKNYFKAFGIKRFKNSKLLATVRGRYKSNTSTFRNTNKNCKSLSQIRNAEAKVVLPFDSTSLEEDSKRNSTFAKKSSHIRNKLKNQINAYIKNIRLRIPRNSVEERRIANLSKLGNNIFPGKSMLKMMKNKTSQDLPAQTGSLSNLKTKRVMNLMHNPGDYEESKGYIDCLVPRPDSNPSAKENIPTYRNPLSVSISRKVPTKPILSIIRAKSKVSKKTRIRLNQLTKIFNNQRNAFAGSKILHLSEK
ncbi:unnamed protein product [Moneuplotes crassus]|uniref:Uncharacterized protein n=1 Tax=Euplotes crassus TaxID=5936 RepID=A0AAD1UJ95_EUPCR|nr:unnamed protein product [Moneuplotes crassus]